MVVDFLKCIHLYLWKFYRFMDVVWLALYLLLFLTAISFYIFFVIDAENMKH